MPAKQEYEPDDRGYIAKNDERKSDQAPSHKGKITLTYDTLKALNAQMKEEGKAIVWLAIWPGKEKGMMSVKAEATQVYRDGGTEPQRGGRPANNNTRTSNGNSRGAPPPRRAPQQQSNDDEDFSDEAPF